MDYRLRESEYKMVVSIEFLGMQRVITQTEGIYMPITETTCVNDALQYVRHHYPDLQLYEGKLLITVNQEIASPDRMLAANDTISFLPFIHGG